MIFIQVIEQDSKFYHKYFPNLKFFLYSTHLVCLLSLKIMIVIHSSFFYTALKKRHERWDVSF